MAVDSTFVTIMALGAGGALVGILLAARCLLWLRWQYARDAQKPPTAEILWRLPLVFVPTTKIPYAFVATAVIAGRHASVPEWLPWTVGGAFALVAIVQGSVAAALGNPDRSGRLARFADTLGARTHGFVFYRVPFVGRKATPLRVAGFPISMAILGLIETLAILVLVAIVVMMPRYESV